MRRVVGGTEHLATYIALLTLSACGGAARSHERSPAVVERCELEGMPARAADSAVMLFHVTAVPIDDCALRLTAASLRPWPVPSDARWTVAIQLSRDAAAIPVRATVHRLHGGRARDALDTGSVLVATEDLELVAYAKARPDLLVVPLPWDRTYVRLGVPPREPLGSVDPAAVRVDARLAEPLPHCEAPALDGENRSASVRSGRAIYAAGDRTARELAERFVGIEDATEAVGLPADELDAALHSGADFAYVVSIPRPNDWCSELIALRHRAPWIDMGSLTALIDTRAHAITRRTQRP